MRSSSKKPLKPSEKAFLRRYNKLDKETAYHTKPTVGGTPTYWQASGIISKIFNTTTPAQESQKRNFFLHVQPDIQTEAATPLFRNNLMSALNSSRHQPRLLKVENINGNDLVTPSVPVSYPYKLSALVLPLKLNIILWQQG